MDSTDLKEGLAFLSTGGSAAIVTFLASYLAENWKWFQAQKPEIKKALSVGASIAIGLGAWAIVTYVPPEVLNSLQAPFQVAALSVITLLGGQAWHKLTK